MICPRCLSRASMAVTKPVLSARQQWLSTTHPFTTSASPANKKRAISHAEVAQATAQRSPSAATSTSAAQPFSAPRTASPQAAGTPTRPSNAAADATPTPQTNPPPSSKPLPRSSVPGGMVLRGLNYFKDKPDPVAMEDHEYPDWLWSVLATEKRSASLGAGRVEQDPRLWSKSDRARRVARKRARDEAKLNPDALHPKTPIYAQAVDLPADKLENAGGSMSAPAQDHGSDVGRIVGTNNGQAARLELRQAMRAKRRKDIQEANFLIGLR